MKTNLKTFLAISLVWVVAYTGYEVLKLSDRIQKIENKLGGPGKIACTEKRTVEKRSFFASLTSSRLHNYF